MNARTAENLLRCFRPGKRADTRIEKAARFAEDDAELAKVLAGQIDFDQQIVDAITSIPAPEDLWKKLSARTDEAAAGKAKLRSQMINPAVITALLGVVVILGIAVFFIMDRVDKFPGREEVENMLAASGKMGTSDWETVDNSTVGQLSDWFYIRNYMGFEAPPELAALPVMGSRIFHDGGRPVAQLAVGKADALRCVVFQFHASEFGVQLPPDGDWKVLTEDPLVGAIRQHGDHCFLITFRGKKSDMQEFLKSLPSK